MPVFYDQLNREVNLPSAPEKIISVVPSQTELLFDLGLDEKIIGITNYCTRPAEKVSSITKIGGTKKLNVGLIKALKPDLIIANKEENDRAQIEELMSFCPVWISDIYDLPGAINMIESISRFTNRKTLAKEVIDSITSQFNKLNTHSLSLRAAYLIWRKPYMVAGKGTFIDSMLQLCGLTNTFSADRYPEINTDMLVNARPDVIFLSSEPYPFSQKHIEEFKIILPEAKIMLVDGEMFSWYGSRLLYAPAYLSSVIELLVNKNF